MERKNIEAKVKDKIERNKKLLDNLKTLQPPPLYASSSLQAARYNMYKILEAQLCLLTFEDRIETVNRADEATGRAALMYAGYYGNLDMIEILVASAATVQIKDKKGRTALHYAALNDLARPLETIFLLGKADP